MDGEAWLGDGSRRTKLLPSFELRATGGQRRWESELRALLGIAIQDVVREKGRRRGANSVLLRVQQSREGDR